jgi:hypothetical protein
MFGRSRRMAIFIGARSSGGNSDVGISGLGAREGDLLFYLNSHGGVPSPSTGWTSVGESFYRPVTDPDMTLSVPSTQEVTLVVVRGARSAQVVRSDSQYGVTGVVMVGGITKSLGHAGLIALTVGGANVSPGHTFVSDPQMVDPAAWTKRAQTSGYANGRGYRGFIERLAPNPPYVDGSLISWQPNSRQEGSGFTVDTSSSLYVVELLNL